jgi:hypothetical protein
MQAAGEERSSLVHYGAKGKCVDVHLVGLKSKKLQTRTSQH